MSTWRIVGALAAGLVLVVAIIVVGTIGCALLIGAPL